MKIKQIQLILLLSLFLIQCKKDPTGIKPYTYPWPTSTPEQQGLNAQKLDSALIVAKNTGFVDAVLVIRNGHLVTEKYFNDHNMYSTHNVKSVSKSFLSAMVGIALQEGFIDSLNEKMLDFFPEYIYSSIDSRKYDITIGHLLTMRMGIARESDNDYQVYFNLYNSANWIKSTIEYPLIDDPGSQFHYNTFQTHLLSGILTKATNQSTKDFATDYLLKPMQIDVDDWQKDPQGYYFGGNAMYFNPREMAVLGYVYLNAGQLNGKQIVPESWVNLTLSASTNFRHPNEYGALKNYNYAYLWWLGQVGGYEIFMAYGYGGQFVMVFPALNLIVVTTADGEVYPDTADAQELFLFDVIDKYITTAKLN